MLSKKTKYALHALTYLGKHRDTKTVLIHDIAEEHGISHAIESMAEQMFWSCFEL